jgi:2-isopropylmalate synthase
VRAASQAGANWLCLCDTNGGNLPSLVASATRAVAAAVRTPIGIHCHNDSDLAVANSFAAVEAGARQVQGTINGVGERCGNANLISIVAGLELKMGFHCIGAENLRRLTELSHFVDELANLTPRKNQAYVGTSAFAHKGGVHVAAVRKNRLTYEHVDPDAVGNAQRVLISDLSGRANILQKAEEFGLKLDSKDAKVVTLLRDLKELENAGYQYEGAEASFEILMKRALGEDTRPYKLLGFRVLDMKTGDSEPALSEATVMIEGPDGHVEHTAGSGNGPVNALDHALRKALTKFYPEIERVRLVDYKVRVLPGFDGTAARVRVLVESGDEHDVWGTVGVSHNVIEASWQALVDSVDYKLYKDRRRREEETQERSRRRDATIA